MLETIIMNIADAVAQFFPFDCMEPLFMHRALLGLLLIAPLAALSGIQVVNFRFSFFSDAIGHSSFAGVALGLIFAVSPLLSMPVLAVAVGLLMMFMKRKSRLSSDTVIGVTYSAVAAFGLAMVSRNRAASRDVNMFLFGDILTISEVDILVLGILLLLFILFQFFAYNRMLGIAINPQIASVHRINVPFYQYTFVLLLSLVVIYSVRAVGVLLVTAILVIPAAAARNLASNTREMFWYSLGISYVTSLSGLILSAQEWANVPVGAAVVLCASAVFAVSFVYATLQKGRTSDMEK